MMSNHFHLLCEVPEPRRLSEAEVLERVEAGYGPTRRQAVQEELARYRRQPDGDAQVQRLLDRYRRRMYDISVFIKATAQRVVEEQNGEIPLARRLLCRIRYFSDGVILGSQGFVESHFGRLKQKLGYKRHRTATCSRSGFCGPLGLPRSTGPNGRLV